MPENGFGFHFLFPIIQRIFQRYLVRVFQVGAGGEASGEAGQIDPFFVAENFSDVMGGGFAGGVGIGGDN